jgi:hypothetical protein
MVGVDLISKGKNTVCCDKPAERAVVLVDKACTEPHGDLRSFNMHGISPVPTSTNVPSTSCSLGLSATSQQYFSLRTNQPPATSQQYFSLRTHQHQPLATSQTNMLQTLTQIRNPNFSWSSCGVQ